MGTRGIRDRRGATSRFVGIEICPLTVGPVVLGVEALGIGRLTVSGFVTAERPGRKRPWGSRPPSRPGLPSLYGTLAAKTSVHSLQLGGVGRAAP